MNRQTRWLAAGLAIGGIFLWLALRQIDTGRALATLKNAQWPWLVVTLLAGLAFNTSKGFRWALLLRGVARPKPSLLFRLIYLGAAANLLVAHSGELLRASLLARRSGASASAILATVAVERVFDFGALVVLSLLAITLDPRVSGTLGVAGAVGLVIVLLAIAGAFVLLRAAPWAVRTGHLLVSPLPSGPREWLLGQVRRGRVGLGPLLNPTMAAKAGLWSLVQWGFVVAAIHTSALAIGVHPPLTGSLAAFVAMVIGLTLPAPPGHLGTTQLAFVVGLGLVGIDAESAVAASLVYSGMVVLPVLLIGAVLAVLQSVGHPRAADSGASS